VADTDPGNDTVDRALRILVYGPVGLACYLKDSAPTFMELFVSRGRREVDGARRAVEERLGRTPPEPPPSTQQRVTDGLGKVAAQATNVVAAMAGTAVNAAASAASGVTATSAPVAPATPAPPAPPTNGAATDLPIPGYDGLSASQVIERLEGLSRGALERVREYELAHRARRTILASIDQLTS
jgi:hypothetical protein